MHPKQRTYILCIFLFSAFSLVRAQNQPIRSLEPKLDQGHLVVIGHFRELLQPEMRETLASGMSNGLNFQLKLLNPQGKSIVELAETIFIQYNVWEKVYILRSSAQSVEFKTLPHFKRFLADSLQFKMGLLHNLPIQNEFRLQIIYSPEPLTASQHRKLNQWLKSEGEIRESQPAMESEPGFSINLSNLLSIFFSKKEARPIFSYRSAPYTLEKLKNK